MTDLTLSATADAVTLCEADGNTTRYPAIWLRDNDPAGLHPQTGERIFDLLSVPAEPQISAARLAGGDAVLDWADGHVSRFPLTFLSAHRPGQPAVDPARVPPTIWRADGPPGGVPRHDAAAILSDDTALARWLYDLAATGVTIVEGVAVRDCAGAEVAERIGFLRETNFGRHFEVLSKPDPNNLAYTASALPLHTDLPNQEVPPGFQFLHCLANEAKGGGSVLADGLAIAAHLRATDPGAFRMLSEVAIPFRFHDADSDIGVHRPVIELAPDGTVRELRFNAHIASVFDMPVEIMGRYYAAYRAFMACTRSPAFHVTLKLRGGEMLAFDNRRVLHGREAFDPSTGFRHLQGCYVDRGEFDSRMRALARQQ